MAGNWFHFTIDFYLDQDNTNLVGSVSSADEWWNFTGNGIPFVNTGFYVESGSSINVKYMMPEDKPIGLYDQILYAVISEHVNNIPAEQKKATIVYVIDWSCDMRQSVFSWLSTMIELLETNLNSVNIGANQYALVGFGLSLVDADGNPHNSSGILVGAGGFGTLINVTDKIDSASLLDLPCDIPSGPGDGYEAIKRALCFLSFDGVTPVHVVLITDRDRDIVNSSFDVTSFASDFVGKQTLLHSIINVSLIDGSGNSALGVIKGNNPIQAQSWVADGVGGFSVSSGGSAAGGVGTTIADYVTPTWENEGVVWSINALQSNAPSFINAFMSLMTDEIANSFACSISVSPICQYFYCETSTLEDKTEIDIEVNNSGALVAHRDPDTGGICLHYRLKFYADSDRQSLVTSYFSLFDQRRWMVAGKPPEMMRISGVYLDADESYSVTFQPEVLPVGYMENQNTYNLTDTNTETPLICGVKYYVDLEIFFADDQTFLTYSQFEYMTNCSSTDSWIWRQNADAKNWISSAQGKTDLRVSKTTNHTLFPAIAANLAGQFMIVWQDHRNNDKDANNLDYNPQIYYALYDSVDDIIWSSGQGYNDTRIMQFGFKPKIITDQAQNFYTIANLDKAINVYKCPLVEEVAEVTSLLTDDSFFDIDGSQRDASQVLKIRVLNEDTVGSYALSDGNIVSVVENCVVRLDVVGVPGNYAVRAKNEDDREWSNWINIDSEIPDIDRSNLGSAPFVESAKMSAYSIDNNRFILPWLLSPGTGVKRICLQVLTFFGISPSFCVDVFSNIKELEYDVSLWKTFSRNEFSDPADTYNGVDVVTVNSNLGLTPIYVKVIFKDPDKLDFYLDYLSTMSRYANLSSSYLTFNVIQQGVNDQFNLSLISIDKGIYKGEFVLDKSDGVYNKDGLAAIVVNVPNPCTATQDIICGYDNFDKYNKMQISILRDAYSKYDDIVGDISPSNVEYKHQIAGVSKLDDINWFKNYYSADDPRLIFGNPRFFITKFNR